MEFFSRTLFYISNPSIQEQTDFYEALVLALDDCSRPPLHLAEVKGDGDMRKYRITVRGEAVIDTGTEITTIEPLLDLTLRLEAVWKDLFKEQRMPVELYSLCLAAQADVVRQYQASVPELRITASDKWPDQIQLLNREFVLTRFVCALRMMGMTPQQAEIIAPRLRRILDDCESLHETHVAGYYLGLTDAVLRVFCALMYWIDGAKDSEIKHQLEKPAQSGCPRGNVQGFRQMVEALGYRTVCLAWLKATETTSGSAFHWEDERDLHTLAVRFRLGCRSEAIPMIGNYQKGRVNRNHAAELLKANISPDFILTALQGNLEKACTLNKPHLVGRAKSLRTELGKFAIESFRKLSHEMCLALGDELPMKSLRTFWTDLLMAFEKGVGGYYSKVTDPIACNMSLQSPWLPAQFDRASSPSMSDGIVLNPGRSEMGKSELRIRLSTGANPGLRLHFEQAESSGRLSGTSSDGPKYRRLLSVQFLAVQTRYDGLASADGQSWKSLARIIAEHGASKHLCVVPIPWFPGYSKVPDDLLATQKERARSGNTLHIVTPAAFATLITVVAREFTDGEEILARLKSMPATDYIDFIGIHTILDCLGSADLEKAPKVREAILQHYEAAPPPANRGISPSIKVS